MRFPPYDESHKEKHLRFKIPGPGKYNLRPSWKLNTFSNKYKND